MTNSYFFPNTLGTYPVTQPYFCAIPKSWVQGDSAEWIDSPFVDQNGVGYDSNTYTLTYVLAGVVAPVTLTATAQGTSWQTNLSTTTSATMTAGRYFWTARLTSVALQTRITLNQGEMTIAADPASQVAGYDGRSTAEIALANAEAALATFQANGRVQAYTIGSRHMTLQKDSDFLAVIQYWRGKVAAEHIKRKGVRGRMIGIRFTRAS